MTFQCLKTPACDALYRVVHVDNKSPTVTDIESYVVTVTSFSKVYDLMSVETEPDNKKLHTTVNSALDYMLRDTSDRVIKYAQRQENNNSLRKLRVDSAILEFILDKKGNLWLVDLQIYFDKPRRLRLQTAKQRSKEPLKNSRDSHIFISHNRSLSK